MFLDEKAFTHSNSNESFNLKSSMCAHMLSRDDIGSSDLKMFIKCFYM